MATTDNLDDYLTALGNSFRYATNSTEKINAQDMLLLPAQLGDAYKDVQKIVSKNFVKDQDINVPLGITKIGRFAYHTGEKWYANKIIIPEGVEKIDNSAFSLVYCKEFHLPKSVKYITSSALGGVDINYKGIVYFNGNLKELLLKFNTQFETFLGAASKKEFLSYTPNGHIYCNNELITDIVIPKEMTTVRMDRVGVVGSVSFEENSQIAKIISLPYCDKLYLPKGTYTIQCSFSENYGPMPSELYFEGTMFDYMNLTISQNASIFSVSNSKVYLNNELVEKLAIPEGIVEVKQYAFYGYDNAFDEVIVPASVQSIGNYGLRAKYNNKGVIRLLGTTPPTIQSYSVFASKYIVPASALNTYKTATNWSKEATKIFPDSDIEVSIDSSLLNNENILYSVDGGDKQQFTNTTLSLEGVGTLTIYNTSTDTIKLGKTSGGTEVGTSGPNTTITYTFTDVSTLYITKA